MNPNKSSLITRQSLSRRQFLYATALAAGGYHTCALLDARGLAARQHRAAEPARLAELRSEKIGFIFQLHHLMPQCTVLENVLLPTLALKVKPAADVLKKRAEQLLASVGLQDRLSWKPAQLSGGEQQRVDIARALLNSPKLLLADEPTGNLDPETTEEIMKLLFQIGQEFGTAIIMATHDYMVINKHPARMLRTEAGRVIDNASIEV